MKLLPLLVFLFALCTAVPASAQTAGLVLSSQKVSESEGGFTGSLGDPVTGFGSAFGTSIAALGDLDGDGRLQVAVGAELDSDFPGGPVPFVGAVWILDLEADGTVEAHVKISATQGGFAGTLNAFSLFGSSVANLGDLNGDGVVDLAVGARGDSDSGFGIGAVWILFLQADGSVLSHQKISATEGGFLGSLDDSDFFGSALASLGDLDGDGVQDLAVGATGDDDGGLGRGAVWILFLNFDGTVKDHSKISDTQGSFTGSLLDNDRFGQGLASLGDLDGDGTQELAVGAPSAFTLGYSTEVGVVWILHLSGDGSVVGHVRIAEDEGGFDGDLDLLDRFGESVVSLGDIDGDGILDLAVGADSDDDGGSDFGACWILFMERDASVREAQKISATAGDFDGQLDQGDQLGHALGAPGDLDRDGRGDLIAGAWSDDDGGLDRGAIWVLFMDDGTRAKVNERNGSGVNALCYGSSSLPLLGTIWTAEVDTSAHPGATMTFVIGYAAAIEGTVFSFGELLVDTNSDWIDASAVSPLGGIGFHDFPIPQEPILAGQEVFTQGALLGGGAEICNALDLVLGT